MGFAGRIVFSLTLAAGVALGQAPPKLEFEVATIKPVGMPSPTDVAAGKLHVGVTVDAQRVDIGFMSVPELMTIAYKVKRYQVVGPDWMSAQRFDVQAKLPDGATADQVPEMLQALLAERFKLQVHRDTKEHAVYALVVGKSGLKMKPAEPPDPNAADAASGTDTGGATSVKMSRGGQGATVMGGRGGTMKVQMGSGGVMHYEFAKMNMTRIADTLSSFLDRPVVDMTEVKGDFQFSVDVTMDDLRNAARAAGVAIPSASAPAGGGPDAGRMPADSVSDPSGSTLFQSVQQLGLKLEARKSPIEIVVVDHVEKMPTEN
jgi:uncharacterized protein (TIGR03435 family)